MELFFIAKGCFRSKSWEENIIYKKNESEISHEFMKIRSKLVTEIKEFNEVYDHANHIAKCMNIETNIDNDEYMKWMGLVTQFCIDNFYRKYPEYKKNKFGIILFSGGESLIQAHLFNNENNVYEVNFLPVNK